MGHYKIPEAPGLVRDSHSKALLSIDKRGLAANLAQRQSAQQVRVLNEEINTLKDDMAEVKQLLRRILDGCNTSS